MNLQEMLRNEDYEKIWEKYCGFLDLTIDEFMQIQERLLMEQIDILYKSKIGKRIMGDTKPASINDFRNQVPLTSYEDYADILLNQEEDALPSKTVYWIKTTWKGGTQDDMKQAPYSQNMIDEHTKCFIASLILATSKKKGEFSLREKDKFLYGMAPLPYLTGLAPYVLKNEIEFEYLPPIKDAESLGFRDRNKVGFELALNNGVDLFFGLSSVLVKIGEEFVSGNSTNPKKKLKPKTFKMKLKLVKAFIKKYIKKQPILPKDLFDFKGIICGGTDSLAFRDKIDYYFGKQPLEIYGGTEITTVAVETWGHSGLTFFPDVNFLEFIPEKDSIRSIRDKKFIPRTLLLNELEANQKYELVTTKYRGGVFVRYRVGDMIECVSLEDKVYNIKLPQIRYVDRISNIIDLAGFTRITEDTIEKALSLSQIEVVNWVACKEYDKNEPQLHIYLEAQVDLEELTTKQKIHMHLKQLDSDYRDIEQLLGRDLLKITLLRLGTFENYVYSNNPLYVKINPSRDTIQGILAFQKQV